MGLQEFDTSVGHSFGLEFDQCVITAIQEVSGLKMEQEVIELKQNTPDGKYFVKKLPGVMKVPEVTLTRGLTADKGFDEWIAASQFGDMKSARRNGAIIVFDYEGAELKRYTLVNAWPKSLEIGAMKAGDTSVLTEKLVVTCEQIKAGDG